jgi:serine protease AprX
MNHTIAITLTDERFAEIVALARSWCARSWGSLRRPLRMLLATTLVAAVSLAMMAGPARAAGAYDPAGDAYSMYRTTAVAGATAWWNAGYTGRGVDVALIDTGVSPVPGLDADGKVLYGPDLSLESQNPAFSGLDTSGHGTFMAGLIAGHDAELTAPYADAPASAYRGIAPDARIVSVKVGVADGGVDVTQVIAAIDWVVQHRNDDGLNIRVINLSYGTNSLQDYTVDPLAYAAEQAWKKGIVVVAAAGNSGYQRGKHAPGLADPAYNPFVIAVGGYDAMGTSASNDDTMGPYSASSAGCGGCRAPDFVGIGSHVQGLRVPNSFVDMNHPEGRLDSRYFRGSGTSQATAIASGSIAMILQRYPSLTPDQVKRFISDNAQKVPGADSQAQGAGEIDLSTLATKWPKSATQRFASGIGTGTIEGARGADHISDQGVVLAGEKDIFGHALISTSIAVAEMAGNSWSGGTWNGNAWSGNSWSGCSWSAITWSGNSWSGNSWSSSSWSGNSWNGNSWSGDSWSGDSWSGNSWSGNSWSGGTWS